MSVNFLEDAKASVEWRDSGQRVDKITRAILIAAEEELGYPLTVVQGGGKSASSYSGTTHNRYGVADLAAYDHERKCKVLISLGCYAYHRPYLQGVWGEHVHFGVIDHPYRDPMLAAQQADWLRNPPLNALAGHARYTDGPTTDGKKIVFNYDPKTELQVRPMTQLDKAREKLVLGIHNIGDCAALLADGDQAKGQIKHLKDVHKDLRGVLKVIDDKNK